VSPSSKVESTPSIQGRTDMKKLILMGVAAVLATSVLAFAQSDNYRWTEQRMARRVVAQAEARLNITPEQRAEIQAILKTEEPAIVALSAQAREERDAMTALPAYDEAAVREVALRYQATNTDIVVERAKVRLELRAVLTPQQLEQLDAMKAKMDSRFVERLDMVIGQL
jgi:Spy/CpxP family protein refolding chaperone